MTLESKHNSKGRLVPGNGAKNLKCENLQAHKFVIAQVKNLGVLKGRSHEN